MFVTLNICHPEQGRVQLPDPNRLYNTSILKSMAPTPVANFQMSWRVQRMSDINLLCAQWQFAFGPPKEF